MKEKNPRTQKIGNLLEVVKKCIELGKYYGKENPRTIYRLWVWISHSAPKCTNGKN
jgi:hypothetical protein